MIKGSGKLRLWGPWGDDSVHVTGADFGENIAKMTYENEEWGVASRDSGVEQTDVDRALRMVRSWFPKGPRTK